MGWRHYSDRLKRFQSLWSTDLQVQNTHIIDVTGVDLCCFTSHLSQREDDLRNLV